MNNVASKHERMRAPGQHSTASLSVAHPPSADYVWYVIFLLTVVNVFNYMDRYALAVLAPSIKHELSLSDTQIGLLSGFAFAFFYAICGIPIARWADRGNRRNIIALALATWSVMTALSGAAQNLWHLFLARFGVGAAEAGGLAPAQSIICDYIPLHRRSGVFAIHTFGLTAGMMIGLGLAGWLSETTGWRWTFVILGLPGLALAAIVRFTLREPPRGFFDAVADRQDQPSSLRADVQTLWRCRTYRMLLLALVVGGFVSAGLNLWWPSFYARVFGLSLSSSVYLGIAVGVGTGIGVLLGGFMANKAAQRDVTRPLLIGAAAMGLALPIAVASLFVESALTSMVLVALHLLLMATPSAPMTAALYSVTLARMRVTAAAVFVFIQSVLGVGLGPLCVGLLSDLLQPSLGAQSLRYAMLLPLGMSLVMIAALVAAARTLRQDLKAVGARVEEKHVVARPNDTTVGGHRS